MGSFTYLYAAVAELAYATDLKFVARKGVRVRVPLAALTRSSGVVRAHPL